MKVLIIEDQENLVKLLKDGLETEGFVVDYCLDGGEGQRRIESHYQDYDAIILDQMLPTREGTEICRQIRNKKINTPVLMLTACDRNHEIITGLSMGADDYLTKPFSFDVLVAHLRALLRRPQNILPPELKAQNIVLNPATRQVWRNNTEIKLTIKEFNLLEYFMRQPNQVISREQLLSSLWDFAFDSFSNVVDVHITNLRKKIGDHKGKILETIFGAGYRLNV